MRIAANLNVLDEVELIERCIRHLRSIGVDLIVLTDFASTDGTKEVLETFGGDPDIAIIRLERHEDYWGSPERMYDRTLAEHEVDRILFLDADEFWIPKAGSLKAMPAVAEADALTVRRLNVPLVEDRELLPPSLAPASYGDLWLVAEPIPEARQKFDEGADLAWVMTSVASKTMVNPRTVDGVHIGAHRPKARDGMQPIVVMPKDIVIAHVPVSSLDRFTRKLQNIERSLATYGHRLVGNQAWHWFRWAKILREGRVEEEYRRQIMTPAQFEAAVGAGVIRSARQLFEQAGE
jgi:glycosyltransferase involved in cell wall biosynthesis